MAYRIKKRYKSIRAYSKTAKAKRRKLIPKESIERVRTLKTVQLKEFKNMVKDYPIYAAQGEEARWRKRVQMLLGWSDSEVLNYEGKLKITAKKLPQFINMRLKATSESRGLRVIYIEGECQTKFKKGDLSSTTQDAIKDRIIELVQSHTSESARNGGYIDVLASATIISCILTPSGRNYIRHGTHTWDSDEIKIKPYALDTITAGEEDEI